MLLKYISNDLKFFHGDICKNDSSFDFVNIKESVGRRKFSDVLNILKY